MRKVLDASAFFVDKPIEGELYTTSAIIAELRDQSSRFRFDAMQARGLAILEPGKRSLDQVRRAAEESGDITVISSTDTGLLALAIELEAVVVTDDFAVQNVAHRLGIGTEPLQQRRASPRQWLYRCTGCGRILPHSGVCEFCGASIKRKLK
jgi:UPF0271 protein